MRGMDEQSDYTSLLEMRAEWEQQADNEKRRFLEEHPGYEQCPQHPERPVVDAGVCTLRFCAECVEDHQRNHAERVPAECAKWTDHDDMRYYSDHPRYSREKE